MKFVPKDQINNIPALVQIMDWRRPGDKPLSEAMVVSFTGVTAAWYLLSCWMANMTMNIPETTGDVLYAKNKSFNTF